MKRIIEIFLKNKKRIWNLLFYFIGIFALRGASLILTPLYTRVFSTAEYGTIELANSVVSFLSSILGLGLCQYIGIEYFHYKDRERTIAIEKNIKMFFCIVTPIVLLMLILNGIGILSINGLDKTLIVFVVLTSYFSYFTNLCLMLCKNQQKTNLMTLLQLITGVITLVLNIIGVCVLGLGIYSTLITTTVINFVFLVMTPRVYKFEDNLTDVSIKYNEVKKVLSISIPLAVTGVVNSILLLGDRWVLNYFFSTSEIGIYSLATKFASIFEMILVNTLTIFYSPYVYKSYQELGIENAEKNNRRNFKLYLLIGFVAVIAYAVLVKLVFPILIDSKYAEAQQYLLLILVGEVFLGATYFKTYLVNYKKRTKLVLLLNIVTMSFNLITNFILIPRFKIWAAAGTTAGAYVLMFLLAMWFNNRIFKEKVNTDL